MLSTRSVVLQSTEVTDKSVVDRIGSPTFFGLQIAHITDQIIVYTLYEKPKISFKNTTLATTEYNELIIIILVFSNKYLNASCQSQFDSFDLHHFLGFLLLKLENALGIDKL